MKNIIWVLLLLCIQSFAQQIIEIEFVPVYQGQKIVLGKKYKNQDLSIEKLQFYVSNIQLSKKNKITFQEEKSHHLIDLADSNSLKIYLNSEQRFKYSQLKFDLGIDSLTNVSGVMGGDLDPMKGMYWAWQSGYINFKLEGKSKKCPSRLNEYQFHLGGYLPPFQSVQSVTLDCNKKQKIIVMLELSTFFKEIDLSEKYRVMSPSKKAQELAKKIAKMFYVYEE